MGSHQCATTGDDVWLTPPHVLDALGPFDLDPCAAPAEANWTTARHHYRLPDDGLTLPWEGRVWCNPPYSNVWRWLDRLANHGTGTALIFARTETAGFQAQVWRRATAVLFLEGRLTFHHRDGSKAAANSGAPSCLVAYGTDDAGRLLDSGLPGAFVHGWSITAVDDQPSLFEEAS
ncbi:DNA N-6-adenine-methyltransferase [Gordonia westfalica]|nr:DNA N-6-adenine-methyltransferase [Gordonia westfalica]SDT85680.1 DNA N-6-adenine-methyltransferase (Dam) [Gordonia westfalica]